MPNSPSDEIKKRIPPGQAYTDKWPVLHEGAPLDFNPDMWRFKVHGLVENPVTATWAEFMAWPKATITTDFHCVTTWSNFDNQWTGTLFTEFAKIVRPKPEAKFVRMADHQGYDTSVPLNVAMDSDVILATHWNGEPLEPVHGGPLRMVIPKKYAWKSCKWLVEVEYLAKDKLGYWEVRGYSNSADPWKEERLT
jgi:DMSO/TMAO reductase YedYZ molybdopterin-dependent catalytic subunit